MIMIKTMIAAIKTPMQQVIVNNNTNNENNVTNHHHNNDLFGFLHDMDNTTIH